MGFVMLFNTIIIIALAKPRRASRVKGPLVEWSSFREWSFTLFSIGIFLTLWGVYFAYYYVSAIFQRSAKAQDATLTQSCVHVDYNVWEGRCSCFIVDITHATYNP